MSLWRTDTHIKSSDVDSYLLSECNYAVHLERDGIDINFFVLYGSWWRNANRNFDISIFKKGEEEIISIR